MAYRTKSEWAAAKAQALRDEAAALRVTHVPSGDWRGVRRKTEALRHLEREAARFDRIARRYREAA